MAEKWRVFLHAAIQRFQRPANSCSRVMDTALWRGKKGEAAGLVSLSLSLSLAKPLIRSSFLFRLAPPRRKSRGGSALNEGKTLEAMPNDQSRWPWIYRGRPLVFSKWTGNLLTGRCTSQTLTESEMFFLFSFFRQRLFVVSDSLDTSYSTLKGSRKTSPTLSPLQLSSAFWLLASLCLLSSFLPPVSLAVSHHRFFLFSFSFFFFSHSFPYSWQPLFFSLYNLWSRERENTYIHTITYKYIPSGERLNANFHSPRLLPYGPVV